MSICRLYMLSTLVLETNVSHWDSPSELEIWPVNSWNSPLQQENSKCGCSGLNLGLLHACTVRALPTEPSPQTLNVDTFCFFYGFHPPMKPLH